MAERVHQGGGPLLKLEHVSKIYQAAQVQTAALDDVCLEVPRGQFLAIMGPSGCGKSTLLNILGLIDSPTAGHYWFMGEDVARCAEQELTVLRRAEVGFVFQNFNLIDDLDVGRNVEIGLIYRRIGGAERRRRVAAALERVSLTHRAKHMPRQLSGGQQQRVAVARALVAEPRLILADEPTGNLDTANGEAVMDMLAGLTRSGITVVMVTHSASHAARADRVVSMLDGRVAEQDAARQRV
jgi:putative ABC transport system ATP-binding protein